MKFMPDPRVIPFQLGKRKCPGEAMAKLEIKIVLHKILNKYYDIISASELSETPNASLIAAPLPFKVIFKQKL